MSFLNLHSLLAPAADLLHSSCSSWVGHSETHSVYAQALICGESFRSPARKLWASAGLLHLMVISGFHFQILAKVLVYLRFPLPLRGLILTSFWGATGMAPAATRAVFHLGLNWLSQTQKLYWTPAWNWLVTIGICLIFNPNWLCSLSLALSGTATLLLIALNTQPGLLALILPIATWWMIPHQDSSPHLLFVLFVSPLVTVLLLSIGVPLMLATVMGVVPASWSDQFWMALENLMLHTLSLLPEISLDKEQPLGLGFCLLALSLLFLWIRWGERQQL